MSIRQSVLNPNQGSAERVAASEDRLHAISGANSVYIFTEPSHVWYVDGCLQRVSISCLSSGADGITNKFNAGGYIAVGGQDFPQVLLFLDDFITLSDGGCSVK